MYVPEVLAPFAATHVLQLEVGTRHHDDAPPSSGLYQ
jgi:hypothetical protein